MRLPQVQKTSDLTGQMMSIEIGLENIQVLVNRQCRHENPQLINTSLQNHTLQVRRLAGKA
jgi:hypothetical protein